MAPEVLRLFVRPKRLQYSTFVEFMQLLVAFSTGPDEFYEQVQHFIESYSSNGSIMRLCSS